VLIVVLVHGCLNSQKIAGLKDYNRNVRAIVQQSDDEVGKQLFTQLAGAASRQAATGQSSVQDSLNQLNIAAGEQLSHAQSLDVPDEMKQAQNALVLSLSLRHDAITKIAQLIQQALGSQAAGDAVNQIAGQMRALDASEVLYSQRVAAYIIKALKQNGIAVGSAGEQVLLDSNFLPNLSWTDPTYVATQIGASAASTGQANGKPAPGTHGHQLDSVSVGSNTLSSGGVANHIPASPAPVFTVKFTNGGQNPETNVKVQLTISGCGANPIKLTGTVASTTPGNQASVQVPMTSAAPTCGPVTIEATVVPVLGEKDASNNTQSYSAIFQ
jgi:hypothetical protein